MPNYVDTVLSWKAKECDKPNKCRIRIYWITWEKAIVIATDITAHPGITIDNTYDKIVRLARIHYDIAPNKLMLIEHYSTNDLLDKDIYFQILVINNQFIRYEIDKSELTKLLGKQI